MSTNAGFNSLGVRLGLVLALGGAACGIEPPVEEVDLAATAAKSTPYKGAIKNGLLTLTGNSESTKVALRLRSGAPSTLDVDVGDDGTADLSFDRTRFDRITLDAGGGDDTIRMDELYGTFTTEEAITILGGAGNDVIVGGWGSENIFGGPGNDVVDGNGGSDVIHLGDGDDTVLWNPGDGSDVIDGEGGSDAMVFSGANIGEKIELAANGARLRFTRDVAAVTMDVGSVERVELQARGGADTVTVNDLAGTGVSRVDVDLNSFPGTPGGDGIGDVVVLNGGDAVTVSAQGATVLANGLGATVAVQGGEVDFDRLQVNPATVVEVDGSPNADTMNVVSVVDHAGVMVAGWSLIIDPINPGKLVVNGQAGADVITGGPNATTFPVELVGGDGNDTLSGGYNNEILRGGAGDDSLVWNPGGRNDVFEGEAGVDTLIVNGANVSERIELAAAGGRLSVTRDIASVLLDAAGVERVNVIARGGADNLVVGNLSAAGVTRATVDLGGADLIGDVVSVTGDTDVVLEGADVVARGSGFEVAVDNGEPGLDRLAVTGNVTVNGTENSDTLQILNIGGRASVNASGYSVLVDGTVSMTVNGLGGDDVLQGGPSTVPVRLNGGDGHDNLAGGQAAEILDGGPGDDLFTWNPGGQSDSFEGGDGYDILIFNGANISEKIALAPSGDHLRITRDIASVTLDGAGLERVEVNAFGGSDTLTVDDLAGTPVTQVDLDLAASGTSAADGTLDTVNVRGSQGADALAVTADQGTVLVSGLAASVRVWRADVFDALNVFGLGGLDTFSVDAVVYSMAYFNAFQD